MDDAAIERLVTLWKHLPPEEQLTYCLLYTSDAAGRGRFLFPR